MDRSQFKFKTQLRVRNYEVDWQGIVHNANYFLYFELGRIEYLKHLGIKLDISTIQSESKVVLVRNEVDYKSPARFDDLLDVYSRVSYIKDSSFGFEGLIEVTSSQLLVSENVAVHVWLHPQSNAPITVPDSFRQIVQKFEGSSVEMIGRK
ncbi:MAG: acyl-CoA thioesterase [Ignavibacteriae bacterium]|nr:acyl-CoA thioesterase [Ignavibacteria bacterium]MBI3363690.1 acyl-CoA thioesterase [Ignavibacteriota bacterium]